MAMNQTKQMQYHAAIRETGMQYLFACEQEYDMKKNVILRKLTLFFFSL